MRTKVILFGGVALLILAALGVSTAQLSGSGTVISQIIKAPSSFMATAPYGTNTLLFATGSRFAAYNYSTGKSQLVSAYAETGGLDAPDAMYTTSDKRYILFHDASVVIDSVLYKTLQARGLNTTVDYWWLYSTQTKTCLPLPTGTLLAKFHDNRIYTLAAGNNGEAINGYSLDGLQPISSVSIVPSTDFFVTTTGYVLQNTDGNIYITKDGIVNRQLAVGANLVAAADDGNRIIITKSQDKTLELLTINPQDGSSAKIASNVVSKPITTPAGLLLFNTNSSTPRFAIYDLATKKTISWKLAPNKNRISTATAAIDSTTGIMSNDSGGYFLVGNNLHSPIKITLPSDT